MRFRLMLAPRRVQGLVYGLWFGVVMMVFFRVSEGRWLGAIVAGVVGGAFYGVFMAMTMSSIYQRMLAGWADDLSVPDLQTVLRAASRGPAPTDPRLR